MYFYSYFNKPYISLWPIRSQFDMDLARAPRRARLTARKKGSGYENGQSHSTMALGTRLALASATILHPKFWGVNKLKPLNFNARN